MNEKIPTVPQEQKEPLLQSVSPEQKELLMEYLRENSDSSIGEGLLLATPEEVELAEKLLSLGLPSGDTGDRHAQFTDSNYKPDVTLRKEAFDRAGLSDTEGLEIRRHNIVFSDKQPFLKIINLIQRHKEESPDGEITEKISNVPGGVLFLGKVIFESNNEKYTALTDEEKEGIKNLLSK